MSGTWRATDHTVGVGISVDEPGSGVLVMRSVPVLDPETRVLERPRHEWRREFSGHELGGLLVEAVEVALHDHSDGIFLPKWVDGRLARNLLVPLQEAIVLAAAGADVFDRTFSDPDPAGDTPVRT